MANSSISVNGEEFSTNNRGLNIVVLDNESGLIIDSVSFDTYQASKPATRKWGVISSLLRNYEAAVCFE